MQHLNKSLLRHRSKFNQLILLNEQAMIISSCDSIFDTSTRQAQSVNTWFPFIESIYPSIWQVISSQPNISFNKVETPLAELPGIYDFTFSQVTIDSKTLVLWCIYDYTDLYEDLKQFQQRKNELEIHRETLERRYKVIQHTEDISAQQNIIIENLNHLQLTYFNKIKSALTAPVNALDGMTFLLTQATQNQGQTYTQQLRFALKRLSLTLDELTSPFGEQPSELLKTSFSINNLCQSLKQHLTSHSKITYSIASDIPALIQGNFLYLQQTLTGIIGNATQLHPNSTFNLKIHLLEKEAKNIKLKFQIEELLNHTTALIPEDDYTNMIYRLSIIKQLLDLQKSNIIVDKQPKNLSITISFDLDFQLVHTD